MSSEIRVNKINNRAGLGTVTYTDTGIIVSGISTASNFKTGTSDLHSAGINVAYADVDDFVDVGSNIKLGNAGVVTATTFSTANVDVTTDKIVVGTGVTIEANQVATGQATFTGIVTASAFKLPDGSNAGNDLTSVTSNIVPDSDNARDLGTSSARWNELYIQSIKGNQNQHILFDQNGAIEMFAKSTQFIGMKVNGKGLEIRNNSRVIPTTSGVINFGDGTNLWNEIHANSFHGSGANLTSLPAANLTGALPAISGANLTNLPPSAPVGGASTNTVFFENDVAVAVNYQITSNKNAMSAGPIAINAGIAVTVPSGSAWTIV